MLALGSLASAQTADQYILHAYPSSYDITLMPNDTLMLDTLMIYEDSGAAVNFVTHNRESWLYVDTIPASPLVTPESLFVFVTAPATPGTYIDTIEIWADSTGNSPLYVPIYLVVAGDEPGDYLVQTNPAAINFTLPQGQMGIAELQVYEYYGRSVPFEVSSGEPWLIYSAYPQVPPYFTPTFFEIVALSDSLPLGTYIDTFWIEPLIDTLPFDPVGVPVTVTVTPPDTSYEIATFPSSFAFTVAQGDTSLSASLEVYEVSGANLGFWCFNYSNWLVLDTTDLVPLVTPETIPFNINAASLAPGLYVDSIIVVSYEAGYNPLAVPVLLEVIGSGDYVVETMPASFEFNLNLGQVGHDSLVVYEVNNATVGFWFENYSSWLTVDGFGMGPYITPMTLSVTVSTGQTGPGVFHDSILIFSNVDTTLFDPVVVPVTMNVGPLSPVVLAVPSHFEITVAQGSNAEDLAMLVYEQYGYGLPFWVETVFGAEWLQIHYPDSLDPTWYTPDSLYFDVIAADLEPGFYLDTLIIFDPLDDTLTFDNVYVPVTLTVSGGGSGYQVETAPQMLTFTAAPGAPLDDSLHVFESYGRAVLFEHSHSALWLQVDPFGMPPYLTPYTLVVSVSEDTLPAGTYVDTIHITPASDSGSFPAVAVPVWFVVGGDSLLCGDANDDDLVNISDAVLMINYIFSGAQLETELCICDVNADDVVNITDVVFLIYYIFGLNFTEPQCCP
jgi:hypothetical protein